MIWYAWALIGVYSFNVICTIALIGKPRDPISPAVATVVFVVNMLMIWAVVELAIK